MQPLPSTHSRFKLWITEHWQSHLTQQLTNAQRCGDTATIDQLQLQLANAIVVANDDILPGRVQFDSVVTVFSIDEEEEQTFQLVSKDESFSRRGLLDQSCPLAQALIGAQEGQVVTVKLPTGANCDYEVTHIRTP